MTAHPAITTLPCGCFFQGRDMVISPQCEQHTEYEQEDEQTEFKFPELSDRAKDKARDNYRRDYPDYDWWTNCYDDFNTIAPMMGISIDSKPVQLMNGKIRYEPAIQFSGFSCQGDGACFEGLWQPVDHPIDALTAVMEHAPQDTKLHGIAFDLAYLSERMNTLVPDTYVKVTHSGHYSHSGCTFIEVDMPLPNHIDWDDDLRLAIFNANMIAAGLEFEQAEAEIKSTLRRFMDWMYGQLQEEYEYLTSDENIDQYLEEMTFDEDGDEV